MLFFPSQSTEKFGMSEDLRKILFSKFIKGVVDFSDIHLLISRESYQDSSIIQKLKVIIIKRILKKLEDELKLDAVNYDLWYDDFNQFLKKGLLSQDDDTEQLLRLQRFKSYLSGSTKKILRNQNKIYFLVHTSDKLDVEHNVYLEQFLGTDLPILLSNQSVDEIIFRKINQYKDFKFVNVENESDDFFDRIREDKGQLVNKLP